MAKRRPAESRPPQPPAAEAGASPAGEGAARRPWWPGALLFLGVLAVFLPALRHGFITYDDEAYVVAEPHVNTGLSWENFRWAWTSFEHSNWHPLTWLSHQLDCTLFGLAPWGHHLTNSLLHAASTLLLFVVLRRTTGFLWRSLVVAALFGLHPLHVESVAWIAERKDVLSTLFWMLALAAYAARARRLRAGRPGAWPLYALAFLALAAGLAAKPMLVTLPCVFLLFDLWPLDRWRAAAPGARLSLVVEKLPFFALSAVSSFLTWRAQSGGVAMQSLENFTPAERIANALLAYALYLGKTLWPTRLAVLYPNFGELPPAGPTLLAAALLLALSAAAVLALRRGRPWALVGWLWFLGTLVPVIGLVQVGGQTMADRYSYVPLVGVFLVVVWAAAEAAARLPRPRLAAGLAAGAVLLACTVLTTRQLARWQDSTTLFRHTIAVTEDNWMAHYNLSVAYGRSAATAAAAREEFARMVAIIATFAERHNRRGAEALAAGRLPEAITALEKARRIKRDHVPARLNLGRALLQTPGRRDEAIAEFRAAAGFEPDNGEAKLLLGAALAQEPGRLDEAIATLRLAVWLLPERAAAHAALGAALAQDPRRRTAAIAAYEEALRLDPAAAETRQALERLRSGGR